jgi:SAM-dependent methyltransferase
MNPAGLSLSLSMSMERIPGLGRRRRGPSMAARVKTWLAGKSRARLAHSERRLLEQTGAAAGESLTLDGLRGLHAGRMARLAATADASVDTVVTVAALAEAPDVDSLLAEIRRVLRPGGRLLFVEPVAAPAGTRLRRLQRTFDWLWRVLAGSVRVPRDLWNDLKTARFGALSYRQLSVPGLFGLPVPHLVGQAMRTGQEEPRPTPVPSRRPAAPDVGTTQPAYAFFG